MRKVNKYLPKWLQIALGVLSLGIAQKLLLTGVLSPLSTDQRISFTVVVLAIILLIVGLNMLAPICIRFYRTYKYDNRLKKVIISYFLMSIFFGVVIGGIGELTYRWFDVSYQDVKMGMLLLTNLLQILLKLYGIYCLVCIYKKLSIKIHIKQIVLSLVIGMLISSGIQLVNVLVGPINDTILSVIDSFLLLGYFNYLLYYKKFREI